MKLISLNLVIVLALFSQNYFIELSANKTQIDHRDNKISEYISAGLNYEYTYISVDYLLFYEHLSNRRSFSKSGWPNIQLPKYTYQYDHHFWGVGLKAHYEVLKSLRFNLGFSYSKLIRAEELNVDLDKKETILTYAVADGSAGTKEYNFSYLYGVSYDFPIHSFRLSPYMEYASALMSDYSLGGEYSRVRLGLRFTF